MASKQERLTDWREAHDVRKSRRELAEVEARVTAAEAELSEAARAVQQAELEQSATVANIAIGKASARDLLSVRVQLTEARGRAERAAEAAEGLYPSFANARAAAEAAEAVARASVWKVNLAAYVSAADALEAVLAQAVEAEAKVAGIYRALGEQFGIRGAWISGPGENIGNAAYGHRRLTPDGLSSWRSWRSECGAIDEDRKRRSLAERAAAAARRLLEQSEREGRRREQAAAEASANHWASTRDLSPSRLVQVSMQGIAAEPK